MKFFGGLMLFLAGALVGVGGVAGGAAIYASVTPVNNAVSMFGLDASKILNKEYGDKTILNFAQSLNGQSFETIGDVAAITPLVDDVYDKLNDALDKGLSITLDKNGMYAAKFDDLGDYLMNYIKDNAIVGKILKLDETSNPALLYICYPKKDDGTYDFDNGRSLTRFSTQGYVSSLLDDATLGDLLTIKESDEILYSLKDTKINDLESGVKALTLSKVMTIDDSSAKILQTLKDTQIGNLSSAISDLTLGQAIDINDGSSKLLKSLASTKITAIGERVNSLTLGEMIDINSSSPKILRILSESTLSTISTDIDKVKIKELYEDSDNIILAALPDGTTIADFPDQIALLKVTDVFADEIWPGGLAHTEANADTAWKYMLTDKDSGEFKTDYRISSDMGKLIDNIQANINKATNSSPRRPPR